MFSALKTWNVEDGGIFYLGYLEIAERLFFYV
jgi:hypothetical protein